MLCIILELLVKCVIFRTVSAQVRSGHWVKASGTGQVRSLDPVPSLFRVVLTTCCEKMVTK